MTLPSKHGCERPFAAMPALEAPVAAQAVDVVFTTPFHAPLQGDGRHTAMLFHTLTPRRLISVLRIAFGLVALAAAVLMLGKTFQGLESVFGLNDKAAHAIAFYGLSIALFTVAPGARRDDLALFVIASALGVELLQGLTGRSVSVMDFLAGAAGVAAAWAPGRIEDLRFEARRHPDQTFAEIAARGRRRDALPTRTQRWTSPPSPTAQCRVRARPSRS